MEKLTTLQNDVDSLINYLKDFMIIKEEGDFAPNIPLSNLTSMVKLSNIYYYFLLYNNYLKEITKKIDNLFLEMETKYKYKSEDLFKEQEVHPIFEYLAKHYSEDIKDKNKIYSTFINLYNDVHTIEINSNELQVQLTK